MGSFLGNNVSIYAGAKILGPITTGDKIVIRANAVETKNVPANAVYCDTCKVNKV